MKTNFRKKIIKCFTKNNILIASFEIFSTWTFLRNVLLIKQLFLFMPDPQ